MTLASLVIYLITCVCNLAALATLAATSAFAQSTVTLSGQLNAGYGKAISTSATKAGIMNNTANGNNVTLAAVEDLGGGLKATADVNMRFQPDGTNASNTTTALGATKDAFAQNVALGVTGGFGTIKAGRFTSGIAAPIGGYDPFGTDAHGVAVTTATSGVPPRSNGTIQYTSPVFNGFKVTAETAFASNTFAAGGTEKDSTQYVLSYAQGAVSAMVGGGTLANNDSVSAFAASYNLGMAKPSIAYVKAGTKEETAFGISVPMGAATIKAGMRTLAYGTAEDINTTAVGVTYALSKRTSVIADFAQTKQTGAANQSGYVLGLRHAF